MNLVVGIVEVSTTVLVVNIVADVIVVYSSLEGLIFRSNRSKEKTEFPFYRKWLLVTLFLSKVGRMNLIYHK